MAFLELFEDLCAEEYCGIMLKKPDKKKERLDATTWYWHITDPLLISLALSILVHAQKAGS